MNGKRRSLISGTIIIILVLLSFVAQRIYAHSAGQVVPLAKIQAPAPTLYNNVLLPRPSWWGTGPGCDPNYTSIAGGAVQLGTASYRGQLMCGPMPENYTTNIDNTVYFGNQVQVNEWECTEAAMRYLYLAYGQHPYVANGGQVVSNITSDPQHPVSDLLKPILNVAGSGNVPSPGDVLSLTNPVSKNNDGAGHVVIVTNSSKVKNGTGPITVVDENGIPGRKSTNGTGTATLQDNNYYISGSPYTYLDDNGKSQVDTVYGWTHPQTLVPNANPVPLQGVVQNQLIAVSAAAADDVWAVGRYLNTTVGHVLSLIEHWDGSHWTYISDNFTSNDVYLTGVKAFPADPKDPASKPHVWVVGFYPQSNGSGQTFIEDSTDGGQTWNQITLNFGILNAIDGVSPNDIWAVGETSSGAGLTLHYANGVWTNESNNTSVGNQLVGVSTRVTSTDVNGNPLTSEVWIAGFAGSGSSTPVTMRGNWDGANVSWTIPQMPNLGYSYSLVSITDTSPTNIWAVGSGQSSPNGAGIALHWNGSAWDSLHTFNVGIESGFSAVSSLSRHDQGQNIDTIWAAGLYSDGSAIHPLLEYTKDGGQTWTQIPTSGNEPSNSYFSGIYVNAANGNVWAVGTASSLSSANAAALTEFFN